jgi:hypothetical protein
MHKPELVKLGMGALLAVNEGFAKEPRFIVLEYSRRAAKNALRSSLSAKALRLIPAEYLLNPLRECIL